MLTALLFASFACSHRPPEAALPADPVQLETFEVVYQRIAETYPYPDMKGVDWQGAHDRLLPQARAATSADELRPVLHELLDALGESHFGIIPGSRARAVYEDGDEGGGDGTAGLELRWVDGGLVVFRLSPGGPAEQAGVHTGERVTALNGRPVAELLPGEGEGSMSAETVAAVWGWRRMSGSIGSTLRLGLEDGDGVAREVSVVRTRAPGEVTHLGFLPPVTTDFAAEKLAEGGLYIRFNAFMTSMAEPFGKALADFAAEPGVVVDVRGNMGGVASLANGLAGFFITESGKDMGRLITREGELRLIVFPRPPAQRYAGKLAILVDEASFSTAEIFAAGLQALGRARVFGTQSPGMALPSRIEALPNGDSLQYAFADFYDPNGRRVEGTGAVPDQATPLTRAALLAGHDPAIDAASCWIRGIEGVCP